MNQDLYASRVTRVLDLSAEQIPDPIAGRLAAARFAALEKMPAGRVRTAPAAAVGFASMGGTAVFAGNPFGAPARALARSGQRPVARWGWRLGAAALPVLALVAGLVSISVWDDDEKVQELADTDTAVLTDVDLPLDTLANRGFGVFLTNSRQ